MRKALFGLATLIGVLTLTAQAQVNTQRKAAPDLKAGLVRETKLKDATVEKMLKAMAPAIKEQLQAGRSVTIEGVGTFQVVRIGEYKDVGGTNTTRSKPVIVPARNYVEFVPTDGLNVASNADGAVPARTVQGYEFKVMPDANPGIKTEGKRTPTTRVR